MEILFSNDQYFMMKVRINNLYVHMYNDSYNYAIDAVKYTNWYGNKCKNEF